MPHPGEILGDRYRLDDRIAAGGMGEVWQATDTVLGRDVAVKTLHAGRAGDEGFQTRFRHEARAMAVLHHPGVADVYDYGQSGSDAYIVMARVNGEALNQRIATHGRLTAAETMSIVAQAGRALEAAHQAGIVHRDVKPGNLIIEPDGTVVLVDFGVARSAESAALTGAKEVVGTALYIAPEQVSKDNTGPKADVYALGVVAYHCLAGHPPFLGDNPIHVAMQHLRDEPPPLPGDVPPAVRAVVETAMAKDPDERFPSAAAMAHAAELAVAGADTTAILAATTTFADGFPSAAAAAGGLTAGGLAAGGLAAGAFAPGVAGAAGSSATGGGSGTAGAGATGAAGAGAAGAGAAGAGAGGYAPGVAGSGPAARSAVPVGAPGSPLHDTSVFPAPPGGRKRGLMLAIAAAVLLATAAAVLTIFYPGLLGNDRAPAGSVSPTPGASKSAGPAASKGESGKSGNGRATTGRTGGTDATGGATGGPTGGATATTNPGAPGQTATPSRAATTQQTTSAPQETTAATTQPEATTTTADTSGSGSGSGNGSGGGSGSGGSGSGSGGGDSAGGSGGSGGGDEENGDQAAVNATVPVTP